MLTEPGWILSRARKEKEQGVIERSFSSKRKKISGEKGMRTFLAFLFLCGGEDTGKTPLGGGGKKHHSFQTSLKKRASKEISMGVTLRSSGGNVAGGGEQLRGGFVYLEREKSWEREIGTNCQAAVCRRTVNRREESSGKKKENQ